MREYKTPKSYPVYGLVKCEHCNTIQEQTDDKPIQDIVCKKCGMTTDKE